MNQYIKNFPVEEVVNLAEQITVRPGEIASKTLAQNGAVSITLFAFDQGEEISTHESAGDAFVTVLEGVGEYTVKKHLSGFWWWCFRRDLRIEHEDTHHPMPSLVNNCE